MPDVATIEDVAGRAGVSVATVSRALRGLPHVSPTTREKVRRIAAELDYRPNPHASRLAAGRSGTIGVALPVLNSWYYGHILAGVEAVVAEDELDMHLVTVGGRGGLERFISDLPALSKQVDGLLIVDLFLPDPLWDDLAGGDLPVATVGLDTGRVDAVFVDNMAAGKAAVAHLIGHGHRRIGFVGGNIGESLELESAEQRRQGAVAALREHDMELERELVAPGAFSVGGGREAMEHLLAVGPPTAVFCASDEMAIGAVWAAREAGLAVPGGLSVVGFDDQPVAEAFGLTTVAQPVGAMAARAAAMVLDRLEQPGKGPARVEMPTHLQVRATTGAIT